MMISGKEKGNIGENIAAEYLKNNGYNILFRNFRTRYGEIDIIGEEDGYIAFIEVKARKNFKMGLPCESVSVNKQRRIARMANLYIAINNLSNRNFRFDIVEMILDGEEAKFIRILKDAFWVESVF